MRINHQIIAMILSSPPCSVELEACLAANCATNTLLLALKSTVLGEGEKLRRKTEESELVGQLGSGGLN